MKKARQPPNLDKLLERLKLSIPIMRATVHDKNLRSLLLSQLVQQAVDDGKAVVMPDNAFVHPLAPTAYTEYNANLGGITAENRPQVEARLAEMGIDGRGNPVSNRTTPVPANSAAAAAVAAGRTAAARGTSTRPYTRSQAAQG